MRSIPRFTKRRPLTMSLDIKTTYWRCSADSCICRDRCVWSSGQIKTILFLLFLCKLCSGCGRAEYSINGECCPMCPPGSRVHRHCTALSSTSCIPCVDETYTDQPHGLEKCHPCSVCDAGLGLETVRHCTSSSDTVCTCLKGHYCQEPNQEGCKLCQKHRTCNPGQYIKLKGSYRTDTVCEGCPANTFSDGFLIACQRHTDCEFLGRITEKHGTPSSDAECEKNPVPIGLIVGITVGIVILAGGIVAFVLYRKLKLSYI